ncbi:Nramp family divalent metal transporter [Noviherbaspirillum pedocola]|uniref:Nramp family divalent metal transporter n=1 Tax=Noviherbaspirillum pedocola TaxID=2801341 RepID=A0A934W1F0_9BURK|nr:Nramp family divalent metal transporter [Noviherbaspirillum pedocola]MBK4735101.1 Nramp family divalent metal transporter [Noviherbaspirillum pedocola]
MLNSIAKYLRQLGPGFITGVSDDDPSGIATYSQAGAQFGTSMLWVAMFSFPLMAAVQEISARIGRVTGRGLAGNLRRHYPPWVLYAVVFLMAVSNIINIGADIGAMAAALELVVGRDRWHLFPVAIGAGSAAALILLPYGTYASLLKWLGISVFSYFGIALFVQVPWAQVGHDLFIPKLSFSDDYLTMLVAVLGTTISPYLFIWQSSVEVEEQRADPEEEPVRRAPEQARSQFIKIRVDTYSGMAISNLVMFFIILTTAVTLHAHGVTQIDSAEQAAKALEPIAGRFAFLLFATGIIGTGLLAVPSLAGSLGYAMGETFKWPTGLDHKPYQATRFYAVIAAATLIGTVLNFIGVDPIKALIISAIINGIVSVPLLWILLLIARNHDIMGKFVIPRGLRIAGWVTFAVMTLAALVTVWNLALAR